MSHTGSATAELFSATSTAPFGLPLDPYQVKGKVLNSVYSLITGTTYLLNDKIFNYNLPSAADENPLSIWSVLNRKNLHNVVPTVYNLDTTNGAGNVLIGYLNNSSSSAAVLATSATLNHIAPVLLAQNDIHQTLPLSIQLATVEYDFTKGELVSNYAEALTTAKNLRLPVLTSTNGLEAQYFSVVSTVLAKLNVANIHLFNGVSAIRTHKTIAHALSAEEIKKVAEKLELALADEISSVLPQQRISFALSKLNEIANTSFDSFEYYGSKDADNVFVVYSTEENTVALFKEISVFAPNAGAIIVKSPAAFDSVKFNSLISSAVKKITVVSESLNDSVSALRLDVQAALFFEGNFSIEIADVLFSSSLSASLFEEAVGASVSKSTAKGSSFRFVLNDNSQFRIVPAKLAHALSLVENETVTFTPVFDNSVNAGLFQVDLTAGLDHSGKFDLILIEDTKILNTVDVFTNLKANGTLLVLNDSETTFDVEKFVEKSLSIETKKILASKKLDLKFLDLNVVGDVEATQGRTQSIAIQTAFWSYTNPQLDPHAVTTKILQAFGSEAELLASVIADQIDTTKTSAFKEIKYSDDWSKLESEEEEDKVYTTLRNTAFGPNPREAFIDDLNVKIERKFDLAKKLMFKEAYGTTTSLRPDLPIENFVVKVKENKRLTPNDYSRNIFHIEFDVSGTGLTYNIGEALGIHGRNNEALVEEFITMYGLEGDDLVEVPSKDDHHILEVRTLRQSLIENLDLFGKPGKRFYESLVEFAQDDEEKKKLEELISPAGADLFKKFQEEEFYTFADVLELFKSVRPSAQDLVQIVPALKRREYSIASSQKLHPNEVHLLVVVVDWVDAKGRTRYGQCSKYLSDLAVGQELVVSVKPSIMKLPPLTTQPIVMAGLGTGLAPFKAFIEERQYQLEQGAEIGEIYLYLGSRHKKQEYLYGEYWEAYMDADVLTHLGAAFSRDQVQKIYIQDKIRENLKELTELIADKNGHFYLCGPTWPVPDISACLQDILEADAKKKGITIDSAKAVEDMKEEGRYVLEVY